MTIKVGINGFGRIGRMVFRAAVKDFPEIEIVAINDLLEPDYLAYMLKYDSVHGRFKGEVAVDGNTLVVNGKKIRLSADKRSCRIEMERSGRGHRDRMHRLFPDQGNLPETHRCGCQESGSIRTEQGRYSDVRVWRKPRQICRRKHCFRRILHHQCLAPVAKVLNDTFGIKRGLMTTVHAATATQKTVDGPSNKDWRGGRGILENIIPSSTGAAKAVGKVIPELNKKLTGMAFRVPTSDVSVVDLTVELNKEASYEDICKAMKAASEGVVEGRARLHQRKSGCNRFSRR